MGVSEQAPPALLFEMMRSFVTLAQTLNLTHAVEQMDSTRQTLRRHISGLEALKGGALFDVRDRRYALSPLGEKLLPEAQDILATATSWLAGKAQQINGLQYLAHEEPDGWFFYQQQHRLEKAFKSSNPLLPTVISAWAAAGGQLAHDALKAVRPHCLVFRRIQGNLVFSEVGEESSFVSWFGSTLAESTIGRAIGEMPGGDNFGRLLNAGYSEIERSQAIRLDHVHSLIPRVGSDIPSPISYERLMLGARFPDESPAILSVIRRTYDLEIKGVSDDMIRRMPVEALM